MHELDIAMSIVGDVCEIRREQFSGKRILKIAIDVGDLSGVDAESLETVFPAASSGTEIEGARLEIRRIRARLRCLACGRDGEFEYPHYSCPACGSDSVEVSGGREMTIKSLEIGTRKEV